MHMEEEGKSNRCSEEEEFATSTTCHGMSFWWTSRNTVQRVFWILLVIGMFCGMVQQVTTRILIYYQYQTSTEVSREFRSSIEFPAVTICNFNRLFFPESQQELLAMQALNKVTSPASVEFAFSINASVNSLSSLTYYNNVTNFTTSEYYARKGFPLVDGQQLFYCRFGARSCTASEFKPVVTDMGKCYTFNADSKTQLWQTAGGSYNGLSFILNSMHWNYTEEAIYGKAEAGIRFQVHSKHVAPDVEKFGYAIPVGRKAYAVVGRKDVSNMYKPWGVCDPGKEKTLKFFANYSLESCMRECYTTVLIERCGCYQFDQTWAKSYAPECTIEQMINCSSPLLATLIRQLTPQSCSCTTPCSFTQHTVRISYAYLPNIPTRKAFEAVSSVSGQYVKENLLALDVAYEQMSIVKEFQSKKIEESALLSDIGGQLGLWIGMSLITVIEVLQYLMIRVKTFLSSVFARWKPLNSPKY